MSKVLIILGVILLVYGFLTALGPGFFFGIVGIGLIIVGRVSRKEEEAIKGIFIVITTGIILAAVSYFTRAEFGFLMMIGGIMLSIGLRLVWYVPKVARKKR